MSRISTIYKYSAMEVYPYDIAHSVPVFIILLVICLLHSDDSEHADDIGQWKQFCCHKINDRPRTCFPAKFSNVLQMTL